MSDISTFLMMSAVLLSLAVILIVLFLKHINLMYTFTEKIRREQLLIHKEILEIKLSVIRIIGEEALRVDKDDMVKRVSVLQEKEATDTKTQGNVISNASNIESSEVSTEELEKLKAGKKLMFSKDVRLDLGDVYINTDIEI